MANTHLAYLDLAIDKFSGTDPNQDAESFIQLLESTLFLETHLQMLVNWQTTLSGRKRCFPLCSEDQPLSGTRTIIPTQQPGRMFEQISSLDFQMDETNSDTEWKWTIVLEEMEKKFGTSYTALEEPWIKGGDTIWREVPQQIMVLKEQLKDDN